MGRFCSVKFCKARQGHGTNLFELPKEGIVRDKWLRSNPVGWKSTKNIFVCSEHFSKESFNSHNDDLEERKRLKVGAVPSIYREDAAEDAVQVRKDPVEIGEDPDRENEADVTEETAAKENGKNATSLSMECVEEELSDAQKDFYTKKQKEFKDAMGKLEELVRKGAKVTPNSDNSVTFRLTETSTSVGGVVNNTSSALQSVSGVPPGTMTTVPPGYRLLMDPKTGRIVGTLPAASIPSVMSSQATLVTSSGQIMRPVLTGSQQPRAQAPQIIQQAKTVVRAPAPPAGRVRPGAPSPAARTPVGGVPASRRSPAPSRPSPGARTQTPATKTVTPPVVDLTKPGVEPVGAPPLRKVFPALSVVARANRTIINAAARRSELDAKVKTLLVHTPAKFTEWLIQQGLVRSEQYEKLSSGKLKLKLGMYSDGKRFPYSGGYVWLHDGSGSRYTSVFKGSIFEIGTTAPQTVIKLIYHWCCQTNIPNVEQWVKVDKAVIDKVYQTARAICVAAVQDEVVNMGGVNRVVEIGVISLGTSTQDGNRRDVRVEVIGVLDRINRNVRLRACEPVPGSSQQERFNNIFEMMPVWVNKASKIVTDYSVDKETLVNLGYRNVHQCSLGALNSARPEQTNQQVMDYLKKVVPKMYQNTLSNLTNSIVQQFLDELSFREMFGQYSLACFDSILQKISSQTQACALKDQTMESRVASIIANPFLDWRYSERPDIVPVQGSPVVIRTKSTNQSSPILPKPSPRVDTGAKRSVTPDTDAESLIAKKMKVCKEMIDLEPYYYATLQGEADVLAMEFKADMAFKCHVCKKVFMNNLEFMKHLHLHVESERDTPAAVDLVDLTQCKYCYKDFDAQEKMQVHLDQTHLMKNMINNCQICNISYLTVNRLILHMMKEHVKAEMPYCCQVCEFRSSIHRELIDHFHEMHDRTDKLQCPLCLKTYSLTNEKGYNSSSAVSFMEHLQKHEDTKKKNFKCKKCSLVFLKELHLKVHLEKDHLSYKEFDEIEPFQVSSADAPIKMPKPDEKNNIKLASRRTGTAKSMIPQQAAFAAVNLEDMAIYDADREKCCECERTMTSTGHYMAYLCCTKCRYSTCCNKAMSVHSQLFHTKAKPEFNLGKPVSLDSPLFCCCGYKSMSGHKMAKHLAINNCRSAYGSKQEARAARVGGGEGEDQEEEVEEEEKEEKAKPYPENKSKTKPRKAKEARSILEELDEELVDLDEEEDENEEEKEGKIKSAKDPDFAEGGEEMIKKKLRQIKPPSGPLLRQVEEEDVDDPDEDDEDVGDAGGAEDNSDDEDYKAPDSETSEKEEEEEEKDAAEEDEDSLKDPVLVDSTDNQGEKENEEKSEKVGTDEKEEQEEEKEDKEEKEEQEEEKEDKEEDKGEKEEEDKEEKEEEEKEEEEKKEEEKKEKEEEDKMEEDTDKVEEAEEAMETE